MIVVCWKKWIATGIALALSMARGLGDEERLYFNDLKAPESIEDLENIQNALQAVLGNARAATVCLELGEEMGSGSGVIVSADGLILTAAHVSGGVDRTIEAVMEDGTRYPVRTLGLLSNTDAAMAKIEGEGPFPFVEIDRENRSVLGDWVMALGHAGGFDQERGLVVRLGRIVKLAQYTIQTDGTLIGGDSGGPLFDLHGRLIGIHSRVGQEKAENRHVMIDEFLNNWETMLEGEFVGNGPFAQRPPGYLGLLVETSEGEEEEKEQPEDNPSPEIDELPEELTKPDEDDKKDEEPEDVDEPDEGALEEEEEVEPAGALILKVFPDTPAEKAGLKEGDRILKIEDFGIESGDQFVELMGASVEGAELVFTIKRGEETMTVDVTLGERPKEKVEEGEDVPDEKEGDSLENEEAPEEEKEPKEELVPVPDEEPLSEPKKEEEKASEIEEDDEAVTPKEQESALPREKTPELKAELKELEQAERVPGKKKKQSSSVESEDESFLLNEKKGKKKN